MRSKCFCVFIVLALVLSACIPDLSDLGLADCMKVCNVNTKTCLDKSETKLDKCPQDPLCQQVALTESKACLTTALTCMTKCVEQTEKKLSN